MSENVLEGVRLMVVDDEKIIRDFFEEALGRRGVEAIVCENGKIAADKLAETPVDLVITDMRMPEMNGMELLRHILGNHPTIPVIMLTAYASVENAVEAMRNGAFDYLCKPVTDLKELEITLVRAMQYRALLVENNRLKGELTSRYKFDKLVGPSRLMQQIFDVLATVSPTQATVLIQGPSGTGKELVARAIHFNSPRAKHPFLQVNCAALPEGLIESELFGHEKGAFTGAIKTTRGKFEAANGGTILLDEIGEMPLGLQAKLLRVLQEREIQRVGSTENVKIDVRLIATTNVELEQAVEDGKFREDLFYRLNVIPLRMPSLEDRREDVPHLANHFLKRYNKLHGRKVERISEVALRWLVNAPWPGNVREARNSVERAVIMSSGDELELSNFFIDKDPPSIEEIGSADTIGAPAGMPTMSSDIVPMAELEKRHILNALEVQEGHRAKTAELLGISIRTLRNKLNEYKKDGVQIPG